MVSLATCDASVTLARRTVLDRVSIELAPGDLLAVVGPNGAGKSTLVRVLSGERAPDAGTATLGGRALSAIAPADLARHRALMPQAAPLAFAVQVREVVEMGRWPFRGAGDRDADKAAVDWALSATGMTALAARPYTRLSGGEQQRAQLARVLAQTWRPDGAARFLLLDEPTASLDLAHQHATLRMARSLAADGTGVLAVVHDLNLALLHATRVAVLDAGRLVACGAPEETLSPERIAATFGISCLQVRDPASGRLLIAPRGDVGDRGRGAGCRP